MALTPREHLEVRNRQEARVMGLESAWDGVPWGALLCVDEDGHKHTLITTDIAFHRMLVATPHGTRAGLTIPPGTYPISRPGWPGEPGWGERS